MRKYVVAAGFLFLASPLLAFHCPADMAKIDAALSAGTDLSDADLAKVKKLRAKGEKQHDAGNHDASVKTLASAMGLLGIK